MLASQFLGSIGALAAIAPAWRALLDRTAAAEPVLTPTWALAWWRAFGPRRRLSALALWDGDALVGLALLSRRRVLTRRAIPTRRIELLMTGEDRASEICSDYVGLLAARGYELTLAHRFARALTDGTLGRWDQLSLTAMNAELPIVHALSEALHRFGIHAEIEPDGACRYIPLPATWDDYLKALPSAGRYTLTRALRDLTTWTRDGGYRLRTADDAASLREGRAILHALHEERWRANGEHGVFADPKFSAFHDDVMPKLLRGCDGQLELHWLEARGVPIAALYNIVYGDKVYFYQSGRKLDVPKGIRPGIAIHGLVIRRAIEARRTEYDFLSGDAQYKRQLSLASRPLVKLRATAPTLRGRAIEVASEIVDVAKARWLSVAREHAEPQER